MLLLSCTALAICLGTGPANDALVDPASTRAQALAAEKRLDWPAAYAFWEQILDRSDPTDNLRAEAVSHVHDMLTKIPAGNLDPAKARSWPTLLVLVRHMDVDWNDKQGVAHHFQSTLTDPEIEQIKKAFATYESYVFRYTDGILRIDPDVRIVEQPVTRIVGDDGFWVGPDVLRPTVLALMGKKRYQTVFSYEKFREGDQALPQAFLGGTYGADQGLNGAAFSEILWTETYPTDGEAELHEWLHEIDWMFSTVLGYPQAASVNPDGGRRVGEEGGDLDYRRPASALNWMGFYIHIMRDHVTRRMWREATMHDPAPNPWLLKRRSVKAPNDVVLRDPNK